MGRRALILVLVAGSLAACRTRLPVDPAPAPFPASIAEETARLEADGWRARMQAIGNAEGRRAPFVFDLEPDRLRDAIRYRPYQPGPGGLLGLLEGVCVCAPRRPYR